MSIKFQIKQAELRDIPIIQEIARQSWYSTYQGILTLEQIQFLLTHWYSSESLTNEIQKRQHKHYLLFEDNLPVGFFAYHPNEHKAKHLRLSRIYLIPEKQRRGYGRSILSFLEEEASKLNCQAIELNVSQENQAVGFYKRMGFEVKRDEIVQIGPYTFHDHIMVKELNK